MFRSIISVVARRRHTRLMALGIGRRNDIEVEKLVPICHHYRLSRRDFTTMMVITRASTNLSP